MKIGDRLTIVHAGLLLFGVAILVRAGKVQLADGHEWSARARRQHFSAAALPAVRGPILDASGSVLVESRELTRLSVAPREVRAPDELAQALARAGVAAPVLAKVRDTARSWVEIPGEFRPADIASVVATRGVYAAPVVDRVYAPSAGVRPIVGRLERSGQALDGIEAGLDSLLRGDSASIPLPRDRDGRLMAPPGQTALPAPGATVTLTIHRTLQDICDRALAAAVDTLQASGGDIVVLNPHTGEILAMASRRGGGSVLGSNTAVTEPFEPGSTLKPFVAAALLARGRARPDEMIETNDGVLTIEGRTIHDIHRAPRMTLAEVIQHSSNVGIVRFAERLSNVEKFELLRDLGFGAPTGVSLPAEAAGILREPKAWSRQSPASLAMGYEIAVTPLQLAAAYAVLANGGLLVQPQIVKEIRSGTGELLFRSTPRVVRRVLPVASADAARRMLVGAVEQGTAMKADLANYTVGGKSGTARRAAGSQGYVPGRYTASFIGVFPGDRPQYVVLVKLDDPRSAIYGGETAAPLTRVVLEAALAARDAALDRNELAGASQHALDSFLVARRAPAQLDAAGVPVASPTTARVTVAADLPPPAGPARAARESTIVLPAAAPAVARPSHAVVPDVAGRTARAAVAALHASGFRVALRRGDGPAVQPAPGTVAPAGSLVHLTVP